MRLSQKPIQDFNLWSVEMDAWPTLEEYKSYENAVISSIGLHGGSFLRADQAPARHAAFRLRYTDKGGAAGLPFEAEEARGALMKFLSEQNDVFVKYYQCMQSKTSVLVPPAAQTSVNQVLSDMNLFDVLSVGEAASVQQCCVDHLKTECEAKPEQRPNAVVNASQSTCYDYHFEASLKGDVRKAIMLFCYTILLQRKKTAVLPASSVPSEPTNVVEGEETRIRIGDVIQDVAEEHPDVDWYDREIEGEIKMKVGMMMAADERRKRVKRKRDELGARIYSTEDEEAIKRYITKAVKYVQQKKK